MRISKDIWAIADTHLGVYGSADKFANKVKDLLTAVDSSSLVVICGDCTNRGRELEWMNFKAIIRPLEDRCKVMYLDGNHDIAFWNGIGPPSPKLRRRFNLFTGNRALIQGPINGVIGLSSTQTRFHSIAQGTLGEQQLNTLRRLLDQTEGQVILAMHHKPIWAQKGLELTDKLDLERVLIDYPGKVEKIICGHKHDCKIIPPSGPWPEIISLPSVCYPK